MTKIVVTVNQQFASSPIIKNYNYDINIKDQIPDVVVQLQGEKQLAVLYSSYQNFIQSKPQLLSKMREINSKYAVKILVLNLSAADQPIFPNINEISILCYQFLFSVFPGFNQQQCINILKQIPRYALQPSAVYNANNIKVEDQELAFAVMNQFANKKQLQSAAQKGLSIRELVNSDVDSLCKLQGFSVPSAQKFVGLMEGVEYDTKK